MTTTFRGWLVEQTMDAADAASGPTHRAELRELDASILWPSSAPDAASADTEIDVAYSSINYKDGLALTGRPGVIRRWPLIPGIDLVGTVTSSDSGRWRPGDHVILNGAGLGESRHGGLAEHARVAGASLVRVPSRLDTMQAAAIGTAGFTAMLSVLAIERHGVKPSDGRVLVTGAAGGVGSVAIAVLARLGYEVVASTGRANTEDDYLRRLGASEIIERSELSATGRPLQSQRWAAVVDAVGSATLVNALAQTRDRGIVTACGLAQGSDLDGTVLPFILRGVTLAGINSVDAPIALREEAWLRLGSDLDRGLLDHMTSVVTLADALETARAILDGDVRGRTVVDVNA